VSASGPGDYFAPVIPIGPTPDAPTEISTTSSSGFVVRLDQLVVIAALCVALLGAGWFFFLRPRGIDGHALTAPDFVASFPDGSDCDPGTYDKEDSFASVFCSSGPVYLWKDTALTAEQIQRSMFVHSFQCVVSSGNAMGYIRYSIAEKSTPEQLNTMIHEIADSFRGDASMSGPECPTWDRMPTT